MKKLFFLYLIFAQILIFGKNWYVSNNSSGNGSGDSWANKRIFNSSINTLVQPGDTVFIDGGNGSLIYDNGAFSSNIEYRIAVNGTISNRIVFTRGIDIGHNGQPIFRTTRSYLFEISNSNYIELSHIKLERAIDVELSGNPCSHIDILNNEFNFDIGQAINIQNASYVRILNNKITTSVIAEGVTNASDDAIYTNTCNNFEVAYNYILGQVSGTNSHHKDLFQWTNHNPNGETSSIHHNFIGAKVTDGAYQGIYSVPCSGNLLIYNNIITLIGNINGSILSIQKDPTTSNHFALSMFNNTIIGGNTKSTYSNQISFRADEIHFKNNLVSMSGNDNLGYIYSTGGLDFNYNQYDLPQPAVTFTSGNLVENWSNWRSVYGQDGNSGISGFTILNKTSTKATDYVLIQGSRGVDEGTDLSVFFADDYAGTPRPQGSAWDAGAFEIKSLNVGSDLVKEQIIQSYANDWFQNNTPDKAIDGYGISVPGSSWNGGKAMPDTIIFDLGGIKSISQVRISFYFWNKGRKYKYALYYSKDKINWQNAIFETWSDTTEWNVKEFATVNARYLSLVSLENNQSPYAGVWEFEAWGEGNQITGINENNPNPLSSFNLYQNYPNPFNPSTKINYKITSADDRGSKVVLKVYDILGNEVSTLINELQGSGNYEVEFRGDNLASGIYIYRIETPTYNAAKKMILLR